jgi:hypothetical protein
MNKIVLLLCLLSSQFVQAASLPLDISGKYRCQGHDFLNNTTFDEPSSVVKTGDTFLFTWKNNNLIFHGTGILQNRTLSVVFWNLANMSVPGVVTYEVLPNGDLKGKWTIKESNKVGDEYCTKLTAK